MEDEARYSRAREKVLDRAWRMGKENKSNSLERQTNPARKGGGLGGTDQTRYWEGVSPGCEITNNCRSVFALGLRLKLPSPECAKHLSREGDSEQLRTKGSLGTQGESYRRSCLVDQTQKGTASAGVPPAADP